MVLDPSATILVKLLLWSAYLADEVEGDHVTGLGNDSIGREHELIVRANGDLHSSGQNGRAVGESRENNAGVHHVDICIKG